MMKIEFKRATLEDTESLIQVQNQSFYSDFIQYGVCPGYNHSKSSMENIILNRITYKIVVDDRIVGDIIIRENNNKTYYLGGLCVIPDYENKGIGQRAIMYIESQYPNAVSWSLETPSEKFRNHSFYEKMGYRKTGERIEGPVTLFLYKKERTK